MQIIGIMKKKLKMKKLKMKKLMIFLLNGKEMINKINGIKEANNIDMNIDIDLHQLQIQERILGHDQDRVQD